MIKIILTLCSFIMKNNARRIVIGVSLVISSIAYMVYMAMMENIGDKLNWFLLIFAVAFCCVSGMFLLVLNVDKLTHIYIVAARVSIEIIIALSCSLSVVESFLKHENSIKFFVILLFAVGTLVDLLRMAGKSIVCLWKTIAKRLSAVSISAERIEKISPLVWKLLFLLWFAAGSFPGKGAFDIFEMLLK